MSSGSTRLNLFKTPVVLEHLFAILFLICVLLLVKYATRAG